MTVKDYVNKFGNRASEFMRLVAYAVERKLELRMYFDKDANMYHADVHHTATDSETFWSRVLASPTMIAFYCDQIGFKESTPYNTTNDGSRLNDPCHLTTRWYDTVNKVEIDAYGVSLNEAAYLKITEYLNSQPDIFEHILFEIAEWLTNSHRKS